MNTVLPCQDQYFVGGQSYNCPYSATTSESSVDVSTETWVSFWAAGLLDNREPQQAPQAQESSSDSNFPVPNSCSWEEAQLSSQLYRNKQVCVDNQNMETNHVPGSSFSTSSLSVTSLLSPLQSQHSGAAFTIVCFLQLQDTLVQKEEELARLHEENNHLRQYLNSALVKCLEEKAKKLLSSEEFSRARGNFRKGKRKPREQRYFPPEIPHHKNAKRNLSSEFANCEEQPGPPVDPWVLRTLGLKDLNTIDDTSSANYSALLSHPARTTSAFPQFLDDAVGYHNAPGQDLPIDCGGDRTAPSHSTSSHGGEFHFPSQLSSPPGGLQTPPYYASDVLRNKTEVAFSTSLSPHCNVKTHSFHQGQAFVRRDEEGGWKFTWVPKQS
ncbi:Geminin coiled-coil domain-containing protein 1 [Camelus dromedarius]|uniref:Geminin coiled-coil domain-containing protein 1 n=1 Tax=Camelus dromedarius TaxID=9838 RepID=A0A5N4EL64_CAMDR|nr:Geminin coiled-coil domain-containing protein 1 [Camelus dromedarius]